MPGARIQSGERVTLRTFEREDIPFIQRSSANPELRLPLGSRFGNQDQIEEAYEDGGSDRFLACLDGDDAGPGQPEEDNVTRIGAVGVEGVEGIRPTLAYWLVPEFQGKGYGKESVSLVIDHIFRVYDTPVVGAGVSDFNEASHGLLESLGFTQEGQIRKDRFVNGEYIDTVKYGLLREEWEGES